MAFDWDSFAKGAGDSGCEDHSLTDQVDVGEGIDDAEPKCPVVLLLDVSGSMSGDRIASLNDGLRCFEHAVKSDPLSKRRCEIAIVTFGSTVDVVQDFVLADGFTAPTLTASGNTPMGAAICQAIDMVESRKSMHKSAGTKYFRPWVFMITDGCPTDTWEIAAQRVRDGDCKERKKFMFFAVAVSNEADMNKLQQIAPVNRGPVKLSGLKFQELFEWLSSSLSSVSGSNPGDQVPLEPIQGWCSTD